MALAALVLAAAAAGTWELFAMARKRGARPHQAAGLAAALAVGCAFAGLLEPFAAFGIAAGLTLLSALARADVS
ncbi:MAG: hypothetical protein U0166_27445, partial [Acidobacteriota bacterium]